MNNVDKSCQEYAVFILSLCG